MGLKASRLYQRTGGVNSRSASSIFLGESIECPVVIGKRTALSWSRRAIDFQRPGLVTGQGPQVFAETPGEGSGLRVS